MFHHIILFFSLIFLHEGKQIFSAAYYKRNSSINLPFKLENSKQNKLLNGLILGKKSFDKSLRKRIKDLNLFHLVTPSGLHLSSAFFFLVFLKRKIKTIFLILLCACSWQITGFFALKRALYLKFLSGFLSIEKSFLILFLCELAFINPGQIGSFTYSFLFIGTIISLRKSSPLKIILGLWLAQSLCFIFQERAVNLLLFPINSFLSFIISISYLPLLLLSIIQAKTGLSIMLETILNLISFSHRLYKSFDIGISPYLYAVFYYKLIHSSSKTCIFALLWRIIRSSFKIN